MRDDTSLSILLVEDNPGDARLLREALQEIDARTFALEHCDSLTQALQALIQRKYDLGVLDLGLPDARGLEVVRRVREAAPDMALVVLTALDDEELAIQSLQEGAQDYLVKADVDSGSLWRALRYALERHQLQIGLFNLALIDDLTGLSNRKGFMNLATQHLQLAVRKGLGFLIGFIDLDGMKHINDTFGHQEGNLALVETAGVLRNSFRQSDILARYGGDEFAVLITDAAEASATTVIERVQEHVRVCNAQPGRRYQLSLSLGIASSDATGVASVEQLLHEADALMYQYKQTKREPRELTYSSTRTS